jgi:hypothetical protein
MAPTFLMAKAPAESTEKAVKMFVVVLLEKMGR